MSQAGYTDELKAECCKLTLPAMMTAILEKVSELPDEYRLPIYDAMCKAGCEDPAIEGGFLRIQPGMSWDEYVAHLKMIPAPIGPWTIEQNGDVFDVYYEASIGDDGKPLCHCVLYHLGITEPIKECCPGGARVSAAMIETALNKDVAEADVVETVARDGASACHWRVRLKA